MQEEIFFYCQDCNAKITVDQLGVLNEGKCPTCGSNFGFSTAQMGESDQFESSLVLNDIDFLT